MIKEKTRVESEEPPLHCRDCPMWYGEENKGWGPCSIKHQRGDVRFITFGGHLCDEGYSPPMRIYPSETSAKRARAAVRKKKKASSK
jgi:hypothetical protein